MKIIAKDNYDRDSVSDTLICYNVDEYWGDIILNMLKNKYEAEYGDKFFVLVPDDHKLYEYKP